MSHNPSKLQRSLRFSPRRTARLIRKTYPSVKVFFQKNAFIEKKGRAQRDHSPVFMPQSHTGDVDALPEVWRGVRPNGQFKAELLCTRPAVCRHTAHGASSLYTDLSVATPTRRIPLSLVSTF